MPNLKDKVALITGAASGIGRESALLFADEGANVLCVDIQLDGAEHTAQDISKAGGTAAACRAMLPSQATARQWSPQRNGSLAS